MATQKKFIAKNGLDNNSNTITNVTDPVNAQDASTKNFSSNASNLSSGTVATARLGTGTASASTYLRGDNTWSAVTVSTLSGLGTNVGTWLATPSSANLAAAITDETGSGSLVFGTSPAITTPTITGTKETKVTMGANAIDLATGNYFSKTISGATTLTVSNVPATGTAVSFILDLTNGGSAVVTWWSGMKWTAGTAPTLTSAGRDVLAFFTHDGGTTWNGLVLAKDIK